MSRTPVALFVYNRLNTTAQVFERIAAAAPPMLLIVADGPRLDRPGDVERCAAVRALVTNPQWNCRLRTNCAARNLGLGRRFSSGLQWTFQQVPEAVILEDDCLPDPTFFTYCDQLLERYRADEQVMMISGDNYQFGIPRSADSYFFSHGVGTYGWATWWRAFRAYDFAMRDWPAERAGKWLRDIWPVPEIAQYWRDRLDETHRGEIDTWDYQWAFAMWRRHGLQITPDRNLISYIGCVADAVHTTDTSAPYCSLPTVPIDHPLVHPHGRGRVLDADVFEFYRMFQNRPHDEAMARTADALVSLQGATQ